ncbi:hypothetical protein PVAP13_6NG279300, partial [Panicum virgatum]
ALLLTCCGLAAAAAGRRSDADAVADLARSLAKPPSTWTTAGGDPCSFEGISCSSSGRVIAIDLAGMGLAGTLPPSLSSLPALESLQLGGNALSGAVPPLRARSLTSLSLDGNAFTSLPKDFPLGMPTLRHLSMDNLPLAPWPFPHAIAGAAAPPSAPSPPPTPPWPARSRRREISLSNNFLQGPVPQFAAGVAADVVDGNCFCLDEPGACNAQVSTLLQAAEGFGYPFYLARAWRGNDPCSGDWLGTVCDSSGSVSMIYLQHAELSGTISPAIADLVDLERLVLAGNNLTGEIPESLTKLTKLELL